MKTSKLLATKAAISFRPLQKEDMPLLHHWLNQPHMRQFYQKTPVSLEDVEAKFLPRAMGKTPTHDHIALWEQKPIGKIQCYKNSDYPDHAKIIDVNEGVSIDLFIGEAEFLNKGFGKMMLQDYIFNIATKLFPNERKYFIAHELDNVAALACSRSVGFQPTHQFMEEGLPSQLFMLDLEKEHKRRTDR